MPKPRKFRFAISFAAVAAAVLFGLTTGSAQDANNAEARTIATQLVALTSKDMNKQIVAQLTSAVWPTIERSFNNKLDQETLRQLRGEFESIQAANLAEVMNDVPDIYVRHFTASELREILTFYRSDVGQKALREMPGIMSETVADIQPRLLQVQTKTQRAFNDVLRRRGYVK